MMLEKHQEDDAADLFDEALKLDQKTTRRRCSAGR